MARKAPLITDQIAALQEENERLCSLYKLFEKAVKTEFGMGIKNIHDLIAVNEIKAGNISSFEEKICSYFDLFYESDKDDFIRIMCSKKSRDYYKKQLHSDHNFDEINDTFTGNNDSFSEDYNYDYSSEKE